jgi:glyoxylase-like metal-dependent hydrolase (beta-lactamase superfamily II)
LVRGHSALPHDQELALARREDSDVAISKDDIRRVPLGHYTRPAGDPLAGQRIVVSAFLVPHPGGTVLFDTGIGEGEPEFDRHYRVVRRVLREGLTALGVGLDEIRLVANCHLHADHCGGNPTLAGRTVFVQRAELAAARLPATRSRRWSTSRGRPTRSSTGKRRSCPECGWCRRPAILTATSRW